MKHLQLLAAALVLVGGSGIAHAAETSSVAGTASAPAAAPFVVQPDALIFSAEGRRIGRVDHIRSVNGAPMMASVVYDGAFVNVPIASLTARSGGYASTMKLADLVQR